MGSSSSSQDPTCHPGLILLRCPRSWENQACDLVLPFLPVLHPLHSQAPSLLLSALTPPPPPPTPGSQAPGACHLALNLALGFTIRAQGRLG